MASRRDSRYRRVPVAWADDPRLRCGGVSAEAFRVYWALRCGPLMGPAIGICRAGAGALLDLLRCPIGAAEDALDELATCGLIMHDPAAGLVYIPGAITACPPPNQNSAAAARGEIASMPASPARDAAALELAAALNEPAPAAEPVDNSGATVAQPLRSDCATEAQPLRSDCAAVAQPQRNDSATTANDQTADSRQQTAGGARAHAREPESPPVASQRTPDPEQSRPATARQRAFAERLLAPYGLTVEAWMAKHCPGRVRLLDAHVDLIRATFAAGSVIAPPRGNRAYLAPEPDDPDLTPEERAAAREVLARAKAAGSWPAQREASN